jgi:hypothetical protein
VTERLELPAEMMCSDARTITDPIVKEVSARYATERKITLRDCSKEN